MKQSLSRMDASTAVIAANLGHIARFEVKLAPAALAAVTEAFGAWAYPKIVRQLTESSLPARLLCAHLSAPSHFAAAYLCCCCCCRWLA